MSGFAAQSGKPPRYLFRADGDVLIQSDKTLLTQALDALLAVATSCSGPEDRVKVSVQTDAQAASIVIQFAEGPLGSLSPRAVMEPYGLKAILPEIGSNALAASRRIVEGQEGALELDSSAVQGCLEFRLRLPVCDRPVQGT